MPATPLISAIQQAAFRDLIPLNVTLELTQTCNIKCVHCYNFDRDEGQSRCDEAPEETSLSLDEIRRVLREISDAGCLFLSLTGGEVFSYPHLFEVLDEAKSLHLAVQLLTNGTRLQPGVVARLARYRNLSGVSVSLYGATAAVHDGVTQVGGSFDRTWAGIRRLRAQGIAVRVKFIVMRQNVHEVAAMIADAQENELPFLIDTTVTQRHDGTAGSLAARIAPADMAALYAGPLRAFTPKGEFEDSQWACNCARGNCAITSKGVVQPCISVPWNAGSIRHAAFATIWKTSPVFARIRGLELQDFPTCSPCENKGYCMRSRGAAYTYSGQYTGVDPFLCDSAAAARTAHTKP